ncbi:MAG: hypothetical protein QG616_1324 [Pseudomonadota bacterium]|jgi:TRAP-type C4-dicarboxylate transport system permease small subunit|nr:hypothetical protein [Pseudomonadota bacterium]MDQ5914225.1 hypothetical protein [Pseudomonadota bacterium]MDQ5942021.1 hypothetical protein [Pseudomonadota bacterium]MDQ5945237.1 hypothetical protein [Pseudomonadota bacterium]
MRNLLNLLYRGTGALAALFMIGVLIMVIAGIVTRELGIYVRGTDDYAGYCMAAAGFLALAYTFKHGEHIRVTLIIERLSGKPRQLLEWLTLAFGSAIACTLAFYSLRLVLNSHEFNDISQGVDATPLWIPQIGMAVGTVVLAIAFLDDLLLMTLGRPVARLAKHSQEPAHME